MHSQQISGVNATHSTLRRMLGGILCSLSLCCFACSHPKPAPIFGQLGKITPRDYQHIVKQWTRKTELYQHLDIQLFMSMTFNTPQLRRAFAVRFPTLYGHGDLITREELAQPPTHNDTYHTFFVTMYTPTLSWNDLDQAESAWQLTLLGDKGANAHPSQIIRIKTNANLRMIYPYLTRFDKAYLVKFKNTDPNGRPLITPHTKKITIQVTSALGTTSVHWRLVSATPSER